MCPAALGGGQRGSLVKSSYHDDDDFDDGDDDEDDDDDAEHGGPAAESRQPCHELESWLILLHTVREQPQWGQTGLLAG